MRLLRSDGDGIANAVLGVLVGKLCDGQAGGEPAVAVSPMHRICAWPERLALSAAIGSISRSPAVHHVRSDSEHALGVRRVAVGRVFSYFSHEACDDVRRNFIDAVVVVAELRRRL